MNVTKKQESQISDKLKKYGYTKEVSQKDMKFTIKKCGQLFIRLGEGIYLLSHALRETEDCMATEESEYITIIANINDYSNQEQDDMIWMYHPSLKDVKESYPENWESIVLMCGFEHDKLKDLATV